MIKLLELSLIRVGNEEYAKEITAYIEAAKKKADNDFGGQSPDFKQAMDAAYQQITPLLSQPF